MRNLISLIVIVSSIFVISISNVYSQSAIKISTEKVLINGAKFYIHTIKQGETLYSISKAYSVTSQELKKYNTDLSSNLKLGATLKIPIVENLSTNSKKSKSIQVTKNVEIQDTTYNSYIYHVISKGETMYSLTKKYSIDKEELISLNPNLEKGFNVGFEIKIPRITNNNIITNAFKNSRDTVNFIYHKIQLSETLYSLSKKYFVKERKIKKTNKGVDFNNLTLGQLIKITRNSKNQEVQNTITQQVDTSIYEADTLQVTADSLIKTSCDSFIYENTRVFNIALLLPIYSEENAKYAWKRKKSNFNDAIIPKSEKFIDFYQGVLLAIDSLKKQKMNINLHFFDTNKDTNIVNSILEKSEMKTMDLIIGPVFTSNLRIVSNFAKENNIMLISPLSQNNVFTKQNPFFIQANPSENTQLHDFIRFVHAQDKKNIIFIHDNTARELSLISEFKTLNKQYLAKNNLDSISIQTFNAQEIKYKEIMKNLISESENIFIIPSRKRAFVYNVLTHINTMVSQDSVIVFGSKSWLNFSNIEPDYLHRVKFHYITPYLVDTSRNEVKQFIKKYRKTFYDEPSEYSYQAFDLFVYFSEILKKYGNNFSECLINNQIPDTKCLQSKFLFFRYENGGFENKNSHIMMLNAKYDILEYK